MEEIPLPSDFGYAMVRRLSDLRREQDAVEAVGLSGCDDLTLLRGMMYNTEHGKHEASLIPRPSSHILWNYRLSIY